jgi:myosin heavy subunit
LMIRMERTKLNGKAVALEETLREADESIRNLSKAERELELAKQHIAKMDIDKAHLQEEVRLAEERLNKLHEDNEKLEQENSHVFEKEMEIEELKQANEKWQKMLKVKDGAVLQGTAREQEKDEKIRQLEKEKRKWKNLAEHPDLSKLQASSSPSTPSTSIGSDVLGTKKSLGLDSHM